MIAQITGVVVRETVPDSIFDQADEVELVDLPPDDLFERLREGKVYLPDQAEPRDREFLQQRQPDRPARVGAASRPPSASAPQMEDYRAGARRSRHLARSRAAAGVRRPEPVSRHGWCAPRGASPAVSGAVDRACTSRRKPTRACSEKDREQLGANAAPRRAAGGRDGHAQRRQPGRRAVHYAPQPQRDQDHRRQAATAALARVAARLARLRADAEMRRYRRLCHHRRSREEAGPGRQAERTVSTANDYLAAFSMVLVCTAISWPLSYYNLATTNLIMVYLLGVLIIAARFGRGPSMLASVLSVAAFDFFFVPPVFKFAVQDTQYLFTFVVMLGTALTISTLTARVAFQAESARKRERRTASLYAISHQLAAAQHARADRAGRHAARRRGGRRQGRAAVDHRRQRAFGGSWRRGCRWFRSRFARRSRGALGVRPWRNRRAWHVDLAGVGRAVSAAGRLARHRRRAGRAAESHLASDRARTTCICSKRWPG